jgi:hypothetical protein
MPIFAKGKNRFSGLKTPTQIYLQEGVLRPEKLFSERD